MTAVEVSRRINDRLPLRLKVKISTETFCTRSVVTKDFSDGGLFVVDEHLAGLKVGTIITVQSDEGMENAPLLRARVAWTSETGAGIEYLLE